MLENAVRICGAKFGNIYRWEDRIAHLVAAHNTPPAFAEARGREPQRVETNPLMGRMLATKMAVQVADIAATPGYHDRSNAAAVATVDLGGARTVLLVPMLKENEPIGSFTLFRDEVRPFTDKQIALVTSFAAQAVIAIENTRLLTELRQRTDDLGRSVGELRALGEVSQAVNSTLDLETVLSTIVAKAVQLSGTEAGAIYVFDEMRREFHLRATYGMENELIDALKLQRIGIDETNITAAMATARADPGRRLEGRGTRPDQQDHPARRLPRPADGAAGPRQGHRRHAGGPPPHAGRLPAKHRRPDQNVRGAIGVGDSERAAVPRDRGQEPTNSKSPASTSRSSWPT